MKKRGVVNAAVSHLISLLPSSDDLVIDIGKSETY